MVDLILDPGWDNSSFDTLYGYEWELTHRPAGVPAFPPGGCQYGARCARPWFGRTLPSPVLSTIDETGFGSASRLACRCSAWCRGRLPRFDSRVAADLRNQEVSRLGFP